MFRSVRLLAFNSFIALAACAAPAPENGTQVAISSGPQCFRVNELRGYRSGPDGLVNIQTAGDRWFQARLRGGCPEFGWIAEIGLRPRKSLWLCEGAADELIAPFPGARGNCYISDVRRVGSGDAVASLDAFIRG